MDLELECEAIDNAYSFNDKLLIEVKNAKISDILDQIGKDECLAYFKSESEN